ncbi:MAG: MMPL family transporter [Prevotellaceae bacterium]|nr:MMPL family transporter [Prevotellaceae bacterium]
MTKFIIRIYDYLHAHRRMALGVFCLLTAVLVVLVSRMRFQEDITAFLPLDSHHQEAMEVYQNISGGNRIFAIFQYPGGRKGDPDSLVAGIEDFRAAVEKADTGHIVRQLTTQVDLDQVAGVTDFVYRHIPYFLTEQDYHRMDSLLAAPGYREAQLERDKQLLLFPSGGMLDQNLSRDPYNLFTPVVAKLQQQSQKMRYELYDGYIFSPDMSRAIVMINSPFGNSETENNGRLVDLLDHCAKQAKSHHAGIEVHLTGGPVIAVGNARQIKNDSILALSIAVVLILALLAFSFRSWKNLLLIAFSIAWGWLFALGCLSLVHTQVSIIVIGISSVIVGIAVNYPLHVIAHLGHTPNMREALKEIVMPLLVGNITTVGAFLALVPLQSTAMRDLGLFASFLLIGTIGFVLVFLPQVAVVPRRRGTASLRRGTPCGHPNRDNVGLGRPQGPHPTEGIFNRIGNFSIDNKRWVVVTVVILTVFFSFFAFRTGFDTNLSHINYMTKEQKADMAYFAHLFSEQKGTQDVYIVASGKNWEEALQKNERFLNRWHEPVVSGAPFLVSERQQRQRLARWQQFIRQQKARLTDRAPLVAAGFTPDAFADYQTILNGHYQPLAFSVFTPLTSSALSSFLSDNEKNGTKSIISKVTVHDAAVARTIAAVSKADPDVYAFDIQDLNSAVANNLSNDFNYIGYACSAIVFFFLWFSMGSIELAALSFLPMAVSWIWILGLMGLFGIDFNIVNVILATFIFGQGDDYTIFMTEGCQYEYTYGKKMLGSYKNSIMLSALIMFTGIGTLILARHPALRSLAVVTIVGMFSVIMMAYLFPPLIFKWLVYRPDGSKRPQPITLRNLFTGAWRREPQTPEELAQAEKDRRRYEVKN